MLLFSCWHHNCVFWPPPFWLTSSIAVPFSCDLVTLCSLKKQLEEKKKHVAETDGDWWVAALDHKSLNNKDIRDQTTQKRLVSFHGHTGVFRNELR